MEVLVQSTFPKQRQNQFIITPPPHKRTPDELARMVFGFGVTELVQKIMNGQIDVCGKTTYVES